MIMPSPKSALLLTATVGVLLVATTGGLVVRPALPARVVSSKKPCGHPLRLHPRPTVLYGAPTESSASELLEEAARLRAEAAEAEREQQPVAATTATTTLSAEDAKAKITAALKRATQQRDKDQLRIALAAAEEAGCFSGNDPVVQKAVMAYNELRELSDAMRKRLVAEARSQGGDPSVNWNPGFAYAGIFVLVAVLVVLGGKDIFY